MYSAKRNVKRFGWSWNKRPRGARKRRKEIKKEGKRAGGREKKEKKKRKIS